MKEIIKNIFSQKLLFLYFGFVGLAYVSLAFNEGNPTKLILGILASFTGFYLAIKV